MDINNFRLSLFIFETMEWTVILVVFNYLLLAPSKFHPKGCAPNRHREYLYFISEIPKKWILDFLKIIFTCHPFPLPPVGMLRQHQNGSNNVSNHRNVRENYGIHRNIGSFQLFLHPFLPPPPDTLREHLNGIRNVTII